MRLWTWDRLQKEFMKTPEKAIACGNHPPKKQCATFDEVLAIDHMQTDIVAEIIDCKCASSMKMQQTEAMEIRRAVWRSPREWIEASESGSIPKDTEIALQKIIRRYARAKSCHRNWSGKRAGVRCYCDEHDHI